MSGPGPLAGAGRRARRAGPALRDATIRATSRRNDAVGTGASALRRATPRTPCPNAGLPQRPRGVVGSGCVARAAARRDCGSGVARGSSGAGGALARRRPGWSPGPDGGRAARRARAHSRGSVRQSPVVSTTTGPRSAGSPTRGAWASRTAVKSGSRWPARRLKALCCALRRPTARERPARSGAGRPERPNARTPVGFGRHASPARYASASRSRSAAATLKMAFGLFGATRSIAYPQYTAAAMNAPFAT